MSSDDTIITPDDFKEAYGEDLYYEYGWKDTLVVVLMKIAGVLSLLSAAGVAIETSYDHFKGKGTAVSRSQFFFQIPISMFALVHFVGAWAAPAGTPAGGYSAGTIGSCEALGFLKQFSLTLVPWDMWISTCHILMVRYNWKEFQLRKYEKWVHIIVWPLGLVAAIFPLVNDNLNLTYDLCGMMSAPYTCGGNGGGTGNNGQQPEECLRGNNNPSTAHIIISVINIVSVLYAVFAMTTIYFKVREAENKSSRYAGSSTFFSASATTATTAPTSSSRQVVTATAPTTTTTAGSAPPQAPSSSSSSFFRSASLGSTATTNTISRVRSRAVATQGILYATATFVAFFPSALEMLLFFIADYEAYWIYTLHRFWAPMIGTFNMMVFFRNRTIMYTRYGKFLRKITSCCGGNWCCRCCCSPYKCCSRLLLRKEDDANGNKNNERPPSSSPPQPEQEQAQQETNNISDNPSQNQQTAVVGQACSLSSSPLDQQTKSLEEGIVVAAAEKTATSSQQQPLENNFAVAEKEEAIYQ